MTLTSTRAACLKSAYPSVTTLEDLVRLAKARGHYVVTATYGERKQVEVRRTKDGYHGREMVRVECFAIND